MDTVPTVEELEAAGFTTAAKEMQIQRSIATPDLREKLRIAFEFYRVVEPKHIERFNKQLKRWTKKTWVTRNHYRERTRHWSYKQLQFCRIESYSKVVPCEVLAKLMEAKKHGCFDYFEVATVQLVQESRRIDPIDPILFGRINDCDNCYFIAQWDDDVKIEDILKEDEG